MTVFHDFQQRTINIIETLQGLGELSKDINLQSISVQAPKDKKFGDIAVNAPMVCAKISGKSPISVAEMMVEYYKDMNDVEVVLVAGAGFINITLRDVYWNETILKILNEKTNYGDSDIGKSEKVNIEFVSANPTGPMHIGHGRGAVVGDVMAAVMKKAGYDVTKEYYINDAGTQVQVLAKSLLLRYRQVVEQNIQDIPSGLYPGEYLVTIAKKLFADYSSSLLDKDEDELLVFMQKYAIDEMMKLIKKDLAYLGVHHDVFSSEKRLVEEGAVLRTIDTLFEEGKVYRGVLEAPKGKVLEDWEEREQLLFRSTDYGDDFDRALIKSDGSVTYFASDIAYHLDKYRRGFMRQVDILGADHGGYVKRMEAAVNAISKGCAKLDVKLLQLVNLMDNNQPLKMSKRAGRFITLRDVIDEVGAPAVRFIMLTRRCEATIDFDLTKVMEQSKDNPVFYVQYAHARVYSVMRKVAEKYGDDFISDTNLLVADFDRLGKDELQIIRLLNQWQVIIEAAALHGEPHRVVFYLVELAAEFHSFWNKGRDNTTMRLIVDNDKKLTMARIAFIKSVAYVIESGLKVLGIVALKEMN